MVAKGKSKAQIRAEDRIAALVNSSGSRSATKRRQRDEIPDVYQDMLSEAAASSEVENVDERPLKKQRVESRDADEHDTEDLKQPLQTVEDSGESDDEDMDWEEIGFDQPEQLNTLQNEAQDEIADISVEVGPKKTSKKAAAKRKPITTAERLMRLAVHEAHVLFLIFHVHVRNSWCNLNAVQSKLKPLLPAKIISLLHPREDIIQFSRSENFINGLKLAVDFWQARFRVVESGMRQSQWAEGPDDIKHQIASISDDIPSVDKLGFIQRASALKGSQDIGNQLFCALLRSVGVEVRLVCSIQPLPFVIAGAKSGTLLKDKSRIYADGHSDGATSAEEGSLTGSASETSKPPQRRRRRIGQPNFAIGGSSKPPPSAPAQKKPKPSTVRKLDYPVFWVEVFNSAYQTWITVDATVTGTINKPGKLEPPMSYKQNTMSYVVAFDEHGYARDVTRRYTKAYNAKTRKLRVESTKNGEKWWRKALKPFRRRDQTDRAQVEDAELAKKEAQEGMPNNVQDFKDHPYYALERHLKRHEAIFPKREVGKLNAGKSSSSNVESVYRRSDVQIVQSADKWYRVGREIKPREQPLKHVPARRGINAQRDDDDEAPMTALYGFSQTTLYIPPKVIDGRIPKNVYGNLDVYVPSMVPPGAVHVRHALGAKAAKVLSIDFADAVTGFTFKGRIGEAVKSGVVVASEYEDAMNATIKGFQDAAKQEEDAKRSLECLRLWRRFLTGLRIGERLGMYENKDATGVSSKKIVESVRKELDETEEKQGEAMEAGGFFPDAGEETMPTASRFGSATAQPRSLLARAQAEAEADEEDETHEEEIALEDISEIAPRLRRQRKVTIQESEEDGGDDDDSADEFVPEEVAQRPASSRRTRGGTTGTSRPAKDISKRVANAGTRRSTRQTRSQRKVVEEASSDEEEAEEDEDVEEVDDYTFKLRDPPDTAMAHDSENGGGGFFVPDTENGRAENIPDDYGGGGGGGGFLPENPPSEPLETARETTDDIEGDSGGGGFIPEEEAEENRGGGFNPEQEERVRGPEVQLTQPRTAITSREDDDVDMYGGGFIPEDKDEDENGNYEDNGQAKTFGKEGQDLDGDRDFSDHGSLLSHDPEDEDAEPEWLNSD